MKDKFIPLTAISRMSWPIMSVVFLLNISVVSYIYCLSSPCFDKNLVVGKLLFKVFLGTSGFET
jgi:hypothetical protein